MSYPRSEKYLNDEGIIECKEKEVYGQCSPDCWFCAAGCTVKELKEKWIKSLDNGNSYYDSELEVMKQLPLDDFEKLIRKDTVDPAWPASVMSFGDAYDEVLTMVERDASITTVIDFGSASGLQGYLFKTVKYIAVDDCNIMDICAEGNETHKASIQDYIRDHLDEFDQHSTLALCLNVPDEEARKLVKDSFMRSMVFWWGSWV